MSEKRGKKRSKDYYRKCANKKPKHAGNNLDAGMKGFLVTCNSHESQAVREMYNLLNEYADIKYGPEQFKPVHPAGDDDDGSDDSEEEDIEKAMLKEVKDLKEKKITERRFQNTSTKAKNCIFIRTTIDDPCELAHSILSDLAESKQQKTRYALRVIPIACTCKAFEKDIKKVATELFIKHFQTPFGTGYGYSILFKTRNYNGIGRESLLPLLGGIVKDMNPLHRVCHDKPDRVILVEVVGPIFCLSVVKDYFRFRKYNLLEVVKGISEKSESDLTKKQITDAEEIIIDASSDIQGDNENVGTGTDVKDTEGTGTDVKDTAGTGTDVKDTEGTGTHVKDTAGTGTHVKDTAGTGTDVKDTEGTGTHVKDTAGTGTDVKDTAGTGTDVKDTEGIGTEIKDTEGKGKDVKDTEGTGTGVKDTEQDSVSQRLVAEDKALELTSSNGTNITTEEDDLRNESCVNIDQNVAAMESESKISESDGKLPENDSKISD